MLRRGREAEEEQGGLAGEEDLLADGFVEMYSLTFGEQIIVIPKKMCVCYFFVYFCWMRNFFVLFLEMKIFMYKSFVEIEFKLYIDYK